jgi:hypothetical protein
MNEKKVLQREEANLEIGPVFGDLIGAAKPGRPCANDDNIRLGVRVHILEVAPGHGAADLDR